MKLNSPLFDRIRVKPGADRSPKRSFARGCQHKGCAEEGTHRAPMGRGREGEYFWFCMNHVREYNATYNYFNGMSDDAVQSFQKDALTGHRPTWSMGLNGARRAAPQGNEHVNFGRRAGFDPFDLFAEHGIRTERDERKEREERLVHNAARKSFEALGLTVAATPDEIKARFKDLAKRHHPDANGGDRSQEERLREIIQAYKYLRQTGFC